MKCRQLRFFIQMFNDMAKLIFMLGNNVVVDEGGVAMRSRYCPVKQYNKDKPANLVVDFLSLRIPIIIVYIISTSIKGKI